jgi:hypothetical protein
MALQKLLGQLCAELDVGMPHLDQHKAYSLHFNQGLSVNLHDLAPGTAMQATIAECPEQKREELFMYLMRANFLSQGTGGARIGLAADEKLLTLSLGIPYEMNYQIFKETIEDFVNYTIYWRDEIAKWVQ